MTTTNEESVLKAIEVAQQAAQGAQQAAQEAKQAAQQIAEAVGQSQRSVIDASRTARSQEIGAEGEFETGMDEFFKFASSVNALNAKRTYDEYQHESLSQIRETREIVERIAQNAVTHDQNINNIALQALQNAVLTADMIGKQAVAHRDIAIEHEWNQNDDTLALKVVADAVVTE